MVVAVPKMTSALNAPVLQTSVGADDGIPEGGLSEPSYKLWTFPSVRKVEINVDGATRVLHERATDSWNTLWISSMPQAFCGSPPCT